MFYRYYSPELGRWLSKDPIEEYGSINLYGMLNNSSINACDYLGLAWYSSWDDFVVSVGNKVDYIDKKTGGHLDGVSNFSAGMGDTLSVGLTNVAREKLGINGTVDKNSSSYKSGEVAGQVVDTALMATGVYGAGKQILKCGLKKGLVTFTVMGAGQVAEEYTAELSKDLLRQAVCAKYLTQEEAQLLLNGIELAGLATKYLSFLRASKQLCFAAGTALLMADGSLKNIEDVVPGDWVMAFDETTGKNVISEVVQLFHNETTTWYEVSAGGDKVKATANHPFYVVEDGIARWIAAKDLKPGMKLCGIDARDVKIDDIRILELETAEITYNFEVAQFHTYYVGKTPVIVHNACKEQVGSYTIEKDGMSYHGKGPKSRMEQSAKERFGKNATGVSRTWNPASNDTDAFIQEALNIRNSGGIKNNPNLLNQINSPGEKILQSLGY